MYDLAIVGAGILGLAHALAASRLGLRIVVVDRDAQANGASIRNFGFVTVTGQERGQHWRRAMRSRDVWQEVAGPAGIDIIHRGSIVVAHRPEALAVVEAFLATEMGERCELLAPAELGKRQPELAEGALGALWSPHEVRVESKEAIPKLAAFLAEHKGVEFRRETAVVSVEPPGLETSRGPIRARAVIVCPGDDTATLFPERIAAYGVERCKLHMLRLAAPGFKLSSAVMGDLSLARYAGFADLPEAAPLKARVAAEQPAMIDNGVHLIVVQSADGSLVVGDSHHYARTPDPFATDGVDELILDEYRRVFAGQRPEVVARWTGTYASANRTMFADTPAENVRLVVITGGTGASTSFAIAEEVVADLFKTDIDEIRRRQ
ncbi:MAG TPA: TIGR03364 family FAD-dependent oxidoreductase [Rhizobiaceae bacterium]